MWFIYNDQYPYRDFSGSRKSIRNPLLTEVYREGIAHTNELFSVSVSVSVGVNKYIRCIQTSVDFKQEKMQEYQCATFLNT